MSEDKLEAFLLGEDEQKVENNKVGEVIRDLGILFGIDISPIEQWRWVTNKFEKKSQDWIKYDIPLVGKLIVVYKILEIRHLFLSSFSLRSRLQATKSGVVRSFWAKHKGFDVVKVFLLVAWDICTLAKEKGGLEIIDLRAQGTIFI